MTGIPEPKRYTSLLEFYPYYLSEYQHTTSRVLHFIGTGLQLMVAIVAGSAAYRVWICMGRALFL